MSKYVITLSRDFASMGRSIAKELAARMGCEFYDRDIVEQTARRMGLPVSEIANNEEAAHNIFYRRIYPLGMGIKSMQDEIFAVQKNIIRDLVAKQSCIIVGRCATAARLKNCVEKLEMDEDTARRTMARVDKARAGYHRVYGGGDVRVNCHVMLNSAEFGIEGSAAVLESIARQKFSL